MFAGLHNQSPLSTMLQWTDLWRSTREGKVWHQGTFVFSNPELPRPIQGGLPQIYEWKHNHCGLKKCIPPEICIGSTLRDSPETRSESYLFLMASGKTGHLMWILRKGNKRKLISHSAFLITNKKIDGASLCSGSRTGKENWRKKSFIQVVQSYFFGTITKNLLTWC